jgi:hypothetical protein
MRLLLPFGAMLLISALTGACTPEDRDAIFSTARPPKVGLCDPQPGYPPPQNDPRCAYVQGVGGNSRGH